MTDSRPIEAWASRLGGKGEPLTLPEAQLFASIAACDRLLEIRDSIQDVQCRLTRLERVVRTLIPGYDDRSGSPPMLPEREAS